MQSKSSVNLVFSLISILFVFLIVALYLNLRTPEKIGNLPRPSTPTASPVVTQQPNYQGKYRNSEFGLIFDYPTSYVLTENYVTSDKNNYYVSVLSPAVSGNKGNQVTNSDLKVEFYIALNANQSTLDTLLSQQDLTNSTKSTEKFAGYPSVVIKSQEQNLTTVSHHLLVDQKLFTVVQYGGQNRKSELSQIINSIRFNLSEDTLKKYTGFIKSFDLNNGSYLAMVDSATVSEDKTSLNNYRIDNPSTQTKQITIADNAIISLIDYDNNMSRKALTSVEFEKLFNQPNSHYSNLFYTIGTVGDKITEISEYFLP